MSYALFHNGLLYLWLGQVEISRARARDLLVIAEEHDFQVWSAVGTCLGGISMARTGSAEEGLSLIRRGATTYQGLRTPPIFFPLLVQMEAEALGLAKRPEEGLALLDQIPQSGEPDSGRGMAIDTWRLQGELLFMAGPENRAQAEARFQQALDIARAVQAPMLELRAAIGLGRMWQAQGRAEEGRQMLQAVYEKFTEGFTTPDLKQARALLENSA
jgi:predicted ATPase